MSRTLPGTILLLAIGVMGPGCTLDGASPSPDAVGGGDSDPPMVTDDAPEPMALPEGSWGGQGVRLAITESGAAIEFDCAAGSITVPVLVDEQGQFEAAGVYVLERGGPLLEGTPPPAAVAATYAGSTDGEVMRLTVTLPGTGEEVGSFELSNGVQAQLDKCV